MQILDGYLQTIDLNEENKEVVSACRKKLVNNIMNNNRIDSDLRDGIKKELSDTFNRLQYQHINDVLSKL